MSGNSFGKIFKLTSFGESHGRAVGGVIEGVPSGLEINLDFIQKELNRRRPGQSSITTARNEEDSIELLSGIFDGKSTGTPIGFIVYNKDSQSKDYEKIKHIYRPSHADFTYEEKYGIRDYRGGGRSSARETLARVAAGAFAKLFLSQSKIQIIAYVSQVHQIILNKKYTDLDLSLTESNSIRCPDLNTAQLFLEAIEHAKKEGNSLGGVITCVVKNLPAGLGEPVFDKLQADLGKAMLSINAVKGFEVGEGFDSVTFRGSELNDEFFSEQGKIKTRTNHSGGIQGGISNGQDVYFRVAFKPTATILTTQNTVDQTGKEVTITVEGRHDPCVLPRAVPIVEAMSALVIADHMLRARLNKV